MRVRFRPAALILRAADSVENRAWSLGQVAGLLAATIAVRNLLEVLVARNPTFPGLAAFVHYPLAYVAPFLALVLILSAWSGRAPALLGRLMALAWLLTLLPPLADLLLHGGTEKPTIGYLQGASADLGWTWLHFFDPGATMTGTTPGIRVETLAAVVLGALYVVLRTRSWWRSIACAVSVYVVSLFFFSLPLIWVSLFQILRPDLTWDAVFRGSGIVYRGDAETAPDSLAICWLVPLVGLLLLAWRWLERHSDDRWFPAGAPAILPGIPAFLVLALWAGFLGAVWLYLPLDGPLLIAPYDILSLAAASLALVLLTRLSLAPDGSARSAARAVGAVAVLAALCSHAALPLAAAGVALAPLGLGVVTPGWRRIVLLIGLPVAALAAFATGFALIVGPEGLARLPLAVAAPVVAAALGTSLVVGQDAPTPLWQLGAGFAAAFGVGGILVGDPRLLVAALPLGFGAAFGGAWIDRHVSRRSLRIWTAVLAGVAMLFFLRGTLATEFLNASWRTQVRAVSRLDLLRGDTYAREGKWDLAKSFYRQALRANPDYVPALRALGLGFLQHEKNLAKALPELEHALHEAPDSPVELGNLAGAYIQADRPADALALLERAEAIDRRNTDVLFNKAQALQDLQRAEAAADAWCVYLARVAGRPEEADSMAHARRSLRVLGRSCPASRD